MSTIWVDSISVLGPGLSGWEHASKTLRDEASHNPMQIPAIASRFLSPNNKRRTSPHMHIAIQAADLALLGTGIDETAIDLIFASSDGDLDIAEDNLQALTHAEKELSPQKFQNVILNAAAGHLGIFMKNCSGSTTLSGHNNTFSIGLLEAYTTLLTTGKSALLVVYDAPSKMPYAPNGRAFFSVGLVLSKDRRENSLAGLEFRLTESQKSTPLEEESLEHLRHTTPAAACLPLLVALAKNRPGPVKLDYTEELTLEVSLCF